MKRNWLKQRNFWEILYVHTLRHIQVKYQETFFGFLWALFMPVMVVLAGVVVRTGIHFLSNGTVDLTQVSSVVVKSLPWAFFMSGLKTSINSLVSNMGIIKKIYFPRVIYPLSYILSCLFDFAVATAVFILVLCYLKVGISIYILWVPVLILILFFYVAGLSIFLSCINLFYRDVRLIIDVILTFAIFITPVYYDASLFGKWKNIVLLNPIGSILEALNHAVVLHTSPELIWVLYAALWAGLISLIGWKVFHKFEPTFADWG